jgi:ubiquitin-conjugating enzyme E2 Z
MSSSIITKETISRLLKDVKQIIKNPLTDQGIYYIHDDTDMMKGYAMIVGPEDTPYFGGFYFFEFYYPHDYPHSPPKVNYCTNGNKIRFNPNLYTCGKVCVSILNTWRGDQWTSCQTISTVLLSLCTLLCKDPLLNEPGVTASHKDNSNYTEIIEHSNLQIAVCDIAMKKIGVYMPFFDNFYCYVKENFKRNYDKLLEFSGKKYSEKYNEPQVLTTSYYSMNVKIDYENVILKLKEAKEMVEIM